MRYFYFVFLCMLTHLVQAQHDTILRTDGREIKARVLTIGPSAISYVPLDTATTDTLRLASAQVFLIRYANGARELIRPALATQPKELSAAEAGSRGTQDARQHFRASGAFWGTYGTTVAYAPIGLATGIAIALTPPKAANLRVPDATLLQNPEYVRSYERQAQRKKTGNAAAGFGAGIGTVLVLAVAILTAWDN
ncbi:hypothetical protein [Hymenobacter elongatus]|uniref:Uncharacterized protein n=1 Tax=Hymenobacter elongatus TaxID=877208 RepID=A0A4Z0PND6_9BACT|nr:hypothetical protein [Hymenobacter elongatus]TGE15937.1 hypothetical protein E5J99_10915 [Hymenobacter elongatus]